MRYRIFPLSENAVTIDFGNEISIELNEQAIRLSRRLQRHSFAGFIETVPAYSSLTVFFDLAKVKKNFPDYETAFSFVRSFIVNSLESAGRTENTQNDPIMIPVDYDGDAGPDLEFVAQNAGLSPAEVIKIHTETVYRVFMIGFLPAFAYMGEVDERIAAPRRQTPRTRIAKGSVGIAGKQTGIYPLESPGGWQIIGRTDLEMFQPESDEISRLKAGDLVRFYATNTVSDGTTEKRR